MTGATAVILALAAAECPGIACAASPAAGWGFIQEPSASLEVVLVTAGPGPTRPSEFGHSLLWIRDRETGEEEGFTFGQSDLHRPEVLLGLIQGRTRVGAGYIDIPSVLHRYAAEGRSVWLQTLALDPAPVARLRAILRSARGTFPYSPLASNCTTQVRDALDRALGGAIRALTERRPGSNTARAHLEPFTRGDPAVAVALALAVGGVADRSLSAWEEMFLPSTLRTGLREVVVPDGRGGQRPLVVHEEVRFVPRAAMAARSTAPGGFPRWVGFLAIGIVSGGVFGLLGRRAPGSPAAGRAFAVVGGGFLVAAGLTGIALAALWFLTDQTLAKANENLFLLNPLALLLADAIWGPAADPRRAGTISCLIPVVAGSGLILKPFLPVAQANATVAAFLLPVYLGLAWGVAGRNREDHARTSGPTRLR